MSFKSILCAYSGETALGSGLAHAIKLAKHHNAFLTGVLRHGRPLIERRFAAHIPASLIAQIQEADSQRVQEVSSRFKAQLEAEGLLAQSDFVELHPEEEGPVSEFARSFDLVVTGVHSEAANEEHLSAQPDLIALKSGRPVLVVPDGYSSESLADRALVAWDGKRSAARAISDAMDILAEKASVTLLSVGSAPRGTGRMVENMKRHGIQVRARTVSKSGSVANTILSEAKKDSARLIVMGAFEHSKFSHDLIGGVTTDVMAKTHVPVLMAH